MGPKALQIAARCLRTRTGPCGAASVSLHSSQVSKLGVQGLLDKGYFLASARVFLGLFTALDSKFRGGILSWGEAI